MGGSMARKESRAPNGHPAELKKEEETAVQQLAGRASRLFGADFPLLDGGQARVKDGRQSLLADFQPAAQVADFLAPIGGNGFDAQGVVFLHPLAG